MYTGGAHITLAASDLNVLEREMNSGLRNLNLWLLVNKLIMNIASPSTVPYRDVQLK